MNLFAHEYHCDLQIFHRNLAKHQHSGPLLIVTKDIEILMTGLVLDINQKQSQKQSITALNLRMTGVNFLSLSIYNCVKKTNSKLLILFKLNKNFFLTKI